MIVKYSISNVEASNVAHIMQDSCLAGSVYSGYGFGAWGIEPTVFIEMSVQDTEYSDEVIKKILFKFRETCAFRIIDGKDGSLVHVSGLVEAA